MSSVPATLDRARAAFLGLALGDAYGRPLEFVLLPAVRTQPVSLEPGVFQWTDDTHMSLYLARAILDLDPDDAREEDPLGRAVGRRFAEWADDPLTPSTAPGNTCLRGARAFAREGDWQRSGDRGSDGCGAVMRIVPVALAYDGPDLVQAARISSVVTHAHKNAVEASIAGAWLCRQAMIAGRFDAALVGRAIGHLRRDWDWGGTVAESLEAALVLAMERDEWLDEDAVPPGDGGWRSGSALGLAVAAALRWGPEGFTTAVERAARIEGDSDSVAALTGMFLGAAGGRDVLPIAWLDALPERDTIVALADALWDRAPATAQATSAAPTAAGATGAATPGATPTWHEDDDLPTVAELAAPPPPRVDPDPAGLGRAVQLRLTGAPALDLDPGTGPEPAPHGLGGPRTSLDHPLRVRWLELSVAGARAPRGRIGVVSAPGRRDDSAWHRSLGVDLDRLVALYDVDHLVVMLDPAERAALGIAELAPEAEARRIVVHALPTAPGATPKRGPADDAVRWALAVARAGRRVVLVGRDGEERPGGLAAAVLVHLGLSVDAAVRAVRADVGPRAAGPAPWRALLGAMSGEAP
ncbi:MAG: ADP-ribosylglycohydrolase family protein [Alphaproteobacteria bacterium]|nr:ADP-ribosylglycohydrolase family protein [Alphaproteobacteria bacterium]